jgi:hypothetical protein
LAGGALAKPPVNQIENPNPRPGTTTGTRSPVTKEYCPVCDPLIFSGAIMTSGVCEPGAYYLVNNYNAGFLPTGEPAPLGPQVFRIPPQTQPTIAEAYRERG